MREEDRDKEPREVGFTMEALEARNEGRPSVLCGMIQFRLGYLMEFLFLKWLALRDSTGWVSEFW